MMLKSKNCASGLLIYFLISLATLTFSGFIFKCLFAAYNYEQLSILENTRLVYALVWGLRFDLASAALLALISCFIVWLSFRFTPNKNPSLFLLGIMLIVQMLFQTGDSIYYADAGRHVSYEVRDMLADASGLFFTAMVHHAKFVMFSFVVGLGVFIGSLFIARRVMVTMCLSKSKPWKFNLQYEAMFFLILLVSAVFIRGGVTSLPQNVTTAFKIGDSRLAVVAMNGTYSVVYGVLNSAKETRRVHIELPDDVNVNTVMNELYPRVGFDKTEQAAKKYNLVFILLEGWPAELMASYGYKRFVTPAFDAIHKKSLSPAGVIAGGRRTTEGMFSIFCSQQNPLGETVSQSSLQNFKYSCLPEILKEKGWSTAFFQGSHKETSGTGAFAQSMGFADSYAKEDMPEGRYERNFWGAHDPDIYDFLINKLDEMPQPFFVGLNTNSTHDLVVPKGVEPFFGKENVKKQHMSILHFADNALGDFFNKIQSKPYYKNTLFVLLSDHSSGRQSNAFYRYLTPGIIYADNLVSAKKVDRLVSQRDFAPTVLDILGYPSEPSFAGKSFYNDGDNEDEYFAEYYEAGTIGWVVDYKLTMSNITDPNIVSCYKINKKRMVLMGRSCDEHAKNTSKQSLAFTAYSQERLFKGETKQFYKFMDK